MFSALTVAFLSLVYLWGDFTLRESSSHRIFIGCHPISLRAMMETVDRGVLERILGKRRCAALFGNTQQIGTVAALRALIEEGITELSGRTLGKVLGVRPDTLRRWLHEGRIRARKVGDKYRYDLRSVLGMLCGGEEVVEYGGKKYVVVSVVPASTPVGTGDIIEDAEFVEMVNDRGYEARVRTR